MPMSADLDTFSYAFPMGPTAIWADLGRRCVASIYFPYGTLLSKRPHDTDTLCANPYFQKDNQESCSEKKHEVLLSHKDVNEFRSRPNTFEPFLLAERLLEESSPSTSSRLGLRKRHGDDDLTEYLTTGSVLGKKKNVGSHEKQSEKKEARFLDLFLADIDEINEIPFFELSLPRELALKIFKHLDVVDLCRCSQVSRAWKSLSEDEVLWCRICHQHGYDEGFVPLERQQWKTIVHDHIVRKQQLRANWKSRTGRFGQLQHVRGGVLCAAHSRGDKVVTGYTNGEIKFWQVGKEGEECLFRPSVASLELDAGQQEGTLSNYVMHVKVSDSHIIAGYSQGYVDLWRQDGITDPIYSFRGPGGVQHLAISQDASTIVANFQSHIKVIQNKNGNFEQVDSLDMQVSNVKLASGNAYNSEHIIVLASGDIVQAHRPGCGVDSMATLSHIYQQNVQAIDIRETTVALGYMCLLDMTYGINLVDLVSCKQTGALKGHTAQPTCISIETAPPHLLVSGCRSSVVRVFDLRLEGFPIMTFQGHQRGIKTVQMDDWKVVSGANDGLVCVWDQRMATKLWELHARHPVEYLCFTDDLLITANIPVTKFPPTDDFDGIPSLRYRGSIHVYDFSSDQVTKGLPSICSSTYDEPEAYNFNVRLAMPYDKI